MNNTTRNRAGNPAVAIRNPRHNPNLNSRPITKTNPKVSPKPVPKQIAKSQTVAVSKEKVKQKPKENDKVRERTAKFDMPLMLTIIVLLVFGLVMLLSASSSLAQREYGDNYYFFNRQLIFAAIGFVVMIGVSFVPYHLFMDKKVFALLVIVTLVMMIAVLTPLGVSQGGARRWLKIGFLFQPSEILKFTLIVVLAYITHKHHDYLYNYRKGVPGFVLFCGIIGFSCLLTVLQPHLSGTIILFAIGLSLMVVSTVRFRYVGIAIALLALALLVGPPILRSLGITHFEARLLSWQNPEADITGDTMQTYQSLITIGSGGWFGLGLGNSRQKFSYLPATNNDFVFPIICEELGFVGGALVLILFAVFIIRGFYIAAHARDRFGMMVAAGITTQVGLQAFLNIAVVTNSIPNTGITLPFFSYGGTALLVLLAELGVLLNISRKAKIE